MHQAEGQALLSELLDPAERGSRGEGWVVAQLATLALLLFPPGVLRTLVNDFGVVLMVAGAVLMCALRVAAGTVLCAAWFAGGRCSEV